jgi:molybdopterin converting factor small subunit
MATVHIPAPLRSLTGGATEVVASGGTLGEVIEELDRLHPGLKSRLVEGERVRPSMATFVDGVQSQPYLSTKVKENADIYFTPAIAGGTV